MLTHVQSNRLYHHFYPDVAHVRSCTRPSLWLEIFNKPINVPHSNMNPAVKSKNDECVDLTQEKSENWHKVQLCIVSIYTICHYIFPSTVCMWTRYQCCQPLWHQGFKVQTLITACTVSSQTVQVHNRLNYSEQCLTITWTRELLHIDHFR